MNAANVLVLVSVLCFTLAALGVGFPWVVLIPLGLTFFAASFLVS